MLFAAPLVEDEEEADSRTANSPGSQTHTSKQLSKHKFIDVGASCPHGGGLVEREKRCFDFAIAYFVLIVYLGLPFAELVCPASLCLDNYRIRVGFRFARNSSSNPTRSLDDRISTS